MEGNQPIGIVESDRILAEALDYHFNEGCCGVIEFLSLDCQTYEHADLIKFTCKGCKKVFTIFVPHKVL